MDDKHQTTQFLPLRSNSTASKVNVKSVEFQLGVDVIGL